MTETTTIAEQDAAAERYAKALGQRRAILAAMDHEDLIEEAARQGVEHSRLNDRYMSLLRDRRSEQDAIRAVALHNARGHADRIAWRALENSRSALAVSLPFLLGLIEELPDKPKVDQVRALRPAAYRLREDLRYSPPVPVEADLAAMLRHELVTAHHDAVLKWQEMGGQGGETDG